MLKLIVSHSLRKLRICFHSLILLFGITYICFYGFGIWKDPSESSRLITPSPLSKHFLYPNLHLINLNHFSYIINGDVCGNKNVSILVIIHSHPSNFERRKTIRLGIPNERLMEFKMERIFLLGRASFQSDDKYEKTSQELIYEESLLNQDLIQGDFEEHYHNLTYKHIMGFQWAIFYCSDIKFVIKMDDDMVVDLYQFWNLLYNRYWEQTNLILGLLQVGAHPIRNKGSKWFVREDEFHGDVYPSFVSGWAYAATTDAVKKIVQYSSKVPYFWIDDVFVTGMLAEAVNVRLQGLNKYFTLHVDHLFCCIELPNYLEYYCDFIVGPTDDDNEIMERVLKHSEFCFINTCKKRPENESVSKTCIRAKVPPLSPVGKGKGEIFKVF